MKIYYLSGTDIPSRAASTVHVMKMCAALSRIGHSVTLLAATSSNDSIDLQDWYGIEGTFRIVRFRRPRMLPKGAGWVFAFRTLLYCLRHGKPDIAYGRHSQSLFLTSLFRIRSAFEAHQLPFSGQLKLIQAALFRMSNFQGIVTITSALDSDYVQLLPSLHNRRRIIAPDAADEPNPTEPVSSWPGRSNALQIGYVGHLYPGKGVEIIAAVSQQLPQFDFHIVGGRDKDIEHWKREIDRPNVFFHGFIKNSKLGAYYTQFQVALAPLQPEVRLADVRRDIARWTSPLKVFEYMSYQLPMLASDLPVLLEILQHERNCLLVPPTDVDAWISALLRLSEDDPLRARIGHAAYEDFRLKYNWKSRCERILRELDLSSS